MFSLLFATDKKDINNIKNLTILLIKYVRNEDCEIENSTWARVDMEFSLRVLKSIANE